MKRSIILFGNCQTQLISIFMDSIPYLHEHYDVLWDRNFENPVWPPKKDLPRHQIENCAYLMEQLGRKKVEFQWKELLPPDCRITRFPYLKLQCLWPFWEFNDPRTKPEPPMYPQGRFPFGDKIIIEMMGRGIPQNSIYDEYMKLDIRSLVDLDRLFEEDMKRVREVDARCDVKVNEKISNQVRVEKLFHAIGHPTDDFFRFLIIEILKASGLIDRVSEVTAFSALKDFFSISRFDSIQVPIHPQICEHFDLQWADGGRRYPYMDYGALTFEEYMRLYINYRGPETGESISFDEKTIELVND